MIQIVHLIALIVQSLFQGMGMYQSALNMSANEIWQFYLSLTLNSINIRICTLPPLSLIAISLSD